MKNNISWRKYIPALIYVLLLLGCLAVVFLAGRFAGHRGGEETSAFGEETSSEAQEQKEESSAEQTKTEDDTKETSLGEDDSLDKSRGAWSGWKCIDQEMPSED